LTTRTTVLRSFIAELGSLSIKHQKQLGRRHGRCLRSGRECRLLAGKVAAAAVFGALLGQPLRAPKHFVAPATATAGRRGCCPASPEAFQIRQVQGLHSGCASALVLSMAKLSSHYPAAFFQAAIGCFLAL